MSQPADRRQIITQLAVFAGRLIDGLLCLLLLAMIILACLQIGLRTFFSGGLLWVDPLLRYLVLWSGMLGAVVATREGKHICIDVVGYLAPEPLKPWIGVVIDLFSTLVAAVLAWAALHFVGNERLFAGPALLGIPSWCWNLVFPLAFGLITLYFFQAAMAGIKTIASSLVRDSATGTGG
ncbi:TRAP transporter small permease [Desulfogranum mediterraneum]|uniref:TRAP transporter small permease n=1 Tax=Desulfogranum mediterraneum TaxID=160661 RepID=UPI0003FF3B84|nr:TRAP transporter small permease subunit [Desulfogranum mediterraneum]